MPTLVSVKQTVERKSGYNADMKWLLLDIALMASLMLAPCAKISGDFQVGQVKKEEKMGWTTYPGTIMTKARQVDIDLEEAVGKNELDRVRELLKKGANPNYDVRPPLFSIHGTHKQVVDMMSLLIEKGGNINAPSYMNASIISHVMEESEDRRKDPDPDDLVRFLLTKGAKTEKLDYSDRTPLHVAVDHDYPKCVKALLDYHANVNARQIRDKYFLADADTNKFYSENYEPGYKESGITPLQSAMNWKFNPEIATMLLKAGADPKAVDDNGWTILHYATFHENMEAVKFCLDQGVKVDSLSKYGSTALRVGIATGVSADKPKVIALLLAKGANPNLRKANGTTISQLFDRESKAELKHLANDPNYCDDLDRKAALSNFNEIARLLKPGAKQLAMPKPPENMKGVRYLPLSWHEIEVSRLVKLEKTCVSLTLGFKCLPSAGGRYVAVKVQKFRLGKVSPNDTKEINLKVPKGQTKTIRLDFPKSTPLDLAIHCTYSVNLNGGFSGSGGTF